ncbi:MAG: S8 family serine peptidase, partial [Planctomycetes bacterium]|nr:S8 family serine peptidase [Planctomycetota bacterium]
MSNRVCDVSRRAGRAVGLIVTLAAAAAANAERLNAPGADFPGLRPVRADLATAELQPTSVYMRIGEIDTTRTLPATRDVGATLRPSESKRYLIQLDGPATPERRERLAAAGVTLHEFMQVNSFIATVRPVAERNAVAALGFVRFASEYMPAWKIDPEIGAKNYATPERQNLQANGRVALIVTLHQGADLQPVLNEIAKFNAPLIHFGEEVAGNPTVSITVDRADAEKLALLDAVQFVEDAFENTQRSNYADRWIMQSNVGSPTPLFPLYANGLRGQGQVLGHIDGRINQTHCSFRDTANPIGPSHRKILAYNPTAGYDQHGTHTAGTSVGWDPASPDTSNVQGVAPDAKLVHSIIPSQTETGTQSVLNLHYTQGARVHTNSWGDDSTNVYTGQCRGIDNHVYNNEESLVVFAVTNLSAIKTPENAKNCLGVNRSTWTPNGEAICGTTCSGPTPDGRRKPEIMAPGCSLTSSSGSGTTACGTASLTGTSMACPGIAGMGLLFREYFVDGYYPTGAPVAANSFNPSAALLKAAMMNSAVDMTGVAGWPGNQEGWGRILADNALFFPGDARKLLVWDVRNAQGMTTGQQTEYTITVGAGQTFEATLVWTEPPAAVNANPAIVNNLDFEVVDPANNLYRGNVLTSGVSTTGGTADNRNNTEVVIFSAPAAGS